MSRKNKADKNGFVYSTDPGFRFEEEQQAQITLPVDQQRLRIWLDSKQRGGKTVTLVTGFVGKDEDLQDLGRQLKAFCGTGGAAKDGEVIVQGDQRDKVLQWLQKKGYKQAKRM